MIYQEILCAITVYHEARGEPLYGQCAVAHIILNRAIIRELSVEKIIYQPYQFSCYNNNKRPPITNYNAFITAQKMVQRAITERLYGFDFYGADHYHATYIKTPSWAKSMTCVGGAGQHLFYRS